MTTVINMFGTPGAGKTTTAAALFSKMKSLGFDCELVTEFAKMAVWEKRNSALDNEIYLFAKKHQALNTLKGQVDYVIIDSPLLLTCVYNDKVKYLNKLAVSEYEKFHNINIFLNETNGVYVDSGRIHTFDETLEIKEKLWSLYKAISGPKLIADAETIQPEEILYAFNLL